MTTERERWCRRPTGEHGATFIEFALVFPIFMTIVLGMFSGGQTYNRKIGITNATGEASRYAATLSPTTFTTPFAHPASAHGLDEWLYAVADVVVQNASGDLDVSVKGRTICVAYVHPAGSTPPGNPDDEGHSLTLTSTGSSDTAVIDHSAGARCFDDSPRLGSERRVQVLVSRPSPLSALAFRYDVTLTARAVHRFEATGA